MRKKKKKNVDWLQIAEGRSFELPGKCFSYFFGGDGEEFFLID